MIALPDDLIKTLMAYLADIDTHMARQITEQIQQQHRPVEAKEKPKPLKEVK